jgi:hypothetical protein
MTMQTAPIQQSRWIAPVSGIALLVVGSCQLIYTTSAALAAIGVGMLELLFMLLRALFSLSNEAQPSDLAPTESGSAFIDSALAIASVGFGLAVIAIAAGILTLREKRSAANAIGASVALSWLLALQHLLINWYIASAIYAVLGFLGAALLLQWRRSHTVTDSAATPESTE